MRPGVLTQYKKGETYYGIEILNIFPEMMVRLHYGPRKYKYIPTIYYIKDHYENKSLNLSFHDESEINMELGKRKYLSKMEIENSIACKNSLIQREELIREVVERRIGRDGLPKKYNKSKLPVYVTLRKRDKLSTKIRKPSVILKKRVNLHHPTIIIGKDKTDKVIYLDMITYNTMKNSYVKNMKRLGLDYLSVDKVIQDRFTNQIKKTPKQYLKGIAV